jgi:hypothetical protein
MTAIRVHAARPRGRRCRVTMWRRRAGRRRNAATDSRVARRPGEPVTTDEVTASLLDSCPVIEAGPYRDLGTWPAVWAHWAGTTAADVEARP